MDWKELFKPTLGKLLLFLLIPGIFIGYTYGMALPEGTKGMHYDFYPMVLYIPITVYSLLPMDPQLQYPITINNEPAVYYNGSMIHPIITILTALFSIVIAYSLSCLIFHIYPKHKK